MQSGADVDPPALLVLSMMLSETLRSFVCFSALRVLFQQAFFMVEYAKQVNEMVIFYARAGPSG